MDLFPAIGTAIQKLQGIEWNEHLQTVNALKMIPTLLQYGPIENINNFLIFYQTHHSLDDIPNPTIRMMDDEYSMVEERTNAIHLHTVSLQRTENKGIQLYMMCLESVLTTPTASYNNQVEENKRLLNLKKLSNEIILGKLTEDTTMELDGEGATNYEQLKDLIRKECDKQDCKYPRLEDKYNKLEQQVTHKVQQNHGIEGPTVKQQRNRRLEEKQIRSKSKPKPKKQQSKKQGVRQSRSTPKTKEKPPKKTAIHGQTMKTKRHPPYKPNQIGDCTNQLERNKHHGASQEKTNTPIWIRCQPITFKPPQHLQCSC